MSSETLSIKNNFDYLALRPRRPIRFVFWSLLFLAGRMCAQQPKEPIDPTPINGETYYFINQLSAMQMDLNNGSAKSGDIILQQPASFTNASQRWAVTKLPDGNWKISNLANGLCLDSSTTSGTTITVQNPCLAQASSQEWSFIYNSNGYNVILNSASGKVLDVTGSSISAGAALDQTSLSATPSQSQLWLFRPAFFRGNDNALLEKQEALRVAGNVPWWQDAGQIEDVLQIMKNHGFNMVRIRPTSIPPYQTYTVGTSTTTPVTCSGNGCYAETDAASLDLAKRAKQLGMSVELSLFFDGSSSVASPGAWSGFSVSQTETAIYNYVKAEVESYRAAGAMPDMVAIGNEVDTGFLGSLGGSPSGAANSTNFENFSAFETSGMQAVTDAASDMTLGPAIPPPIRCIHITPAWDLTSFFGQVNTDKVPYDAMCQSYYPIFHGPLTAVQAAASNPNNKPIEQTALTNAANSIAKPIFLIEIGEHYENGFDANDPWYAPTLVGQRQFVLDLQSVLKGLPNNLAMGFEYWDAEGTNIPNKTGFANGDGQTDTIFVWNGLTLFDNADTSGTSSSSAATYNTVLPALTALGGKLDPTLAYKLVNAADGTVLEAAAASTVSGSSLDTAVDTGVTSLSQEWKISSNNDGFFQIANLNPAPTANVLDTQGSTVQGAPVTQVAAATGTASQEWDIITAGSGYFTVVNKASGMVLAAVAGTSAADALQQQAPSSVNADWITPAAKNQTWQIVPAHISIPSTATTLAFGSAMLPSAGPGGNPGTVIVSLEDAGGAIIGMPAVPVTLTITGPGSFSQTSNATSANGIASFNLSNVVLNAPGSYNFSAASPGLTTATATLTVKALPGTTTALTPSATNILTGASVTFTATVTGTTGNPAPSGMVAFLDGTAQLGTGALSSNVATYATAALAIGTHGITANYLGDTNNAASVSLPVQIVVSPPPDFAISLSPSSASVAPGSSTTTTISITPSGGFSASTSFACSGLPAATACSFSPVTLTPSGAVATTTLTITTNVNSASLDMARPNPGVGKHRGGASSGSLAAVLAMFAVPYLFRVKRRNWCSVPCVIFLAIGLCLVSGCGSSSANQTPTPAPVTPAGPSTVTITATSGSLAHTAAFQLTIQ